MNEPRQVFIVVRVYLQGTLGIFMSGLIIPQLIIQRKQVVIRLGREPRVTLIVGSRRSRIEMIRSPPETPLVGE